MTRLIYVALAMVLIVSDAVADSLPKADANFAPVDLDQVRLGQLLLYDPILSKSKTVACTRHHPKPATADDVSLASATAPMDSDRIGQLIAKTCPNSGHRARRQRFSTWVAIILR